MAGLYTNAHTHSIMSYSRVHYCMHSKNAQSCYPSDTQFVKKPLEFVLVVTWYIVYGINIHLRPSELLFSLFIHPHSSSRCYPAKQN